MSIEQSTAIRVDDVFPDFGSEPSQVIELVKFAFVEAEISAGEGGLGFDLESISLELSVVMASDGAGGFKIKIPWVDWELGGKVSIGQEQTQKINVELAVPAAASEDAIRQPIDIPLSNALLDIAGIVKAGKQNGLVLKGASIDLQLVYTSGGELTLLAVDAKTKKATTQKLTVKVK